MVTHRLMKERADRLHNIASRMAWIWPLRDLSLDVRETALLAQDAAEDMVLHIGRSRTANMPEKIGRDD